MITKVNWYTIDDRDYYAAWSGDEHDHNGEIPDDVLDAAVWLAEQFPGAAIQEIAAD